MSDLREIHGLTTSGFYSAQRLYELTELLLSYGNDYSLSKQDINDLIKTSEMMQDLYGEIIRKISQNA